MRKMTTAGFLESCNAGGHLQITSGSLAISNAYERRPKRSPRLSVDNGCDEVACEQLLHRDVWEAFAASLIACDCVRQK